MILRVFIVNNENCLARNLRYVLKGIHFVPIYSRRQIGRLRKNQVFVKIIFLNSILCEPFYRFDIIKNCERLPFNKALPLIGCLRAKLLRNIL